MARPMIAPPLYKKTALAGTPDFRHENKNRKPH